MNISRRTGIILAIAGALVLAGGTVGLTSSEVARNTDVNVADDTNAFLGVSKDPDSGGTITTTADEILKLTNQYGTQVTASTIEITGASGSSNTYGTGDFVITTNFDSGDTLSAGNNGTVMVKCDDTNPTGSDTVDITFRVVIEDSDGSISTELKRTVSHSVQCDG